MISEAVIANKAWIGAGIFATLFIAERLAPAAPVATNAGRLVRNGVLWALLMALSPAIVLPLTLYAGDHALWMRSGALPETATLVVDLILLDLWSYWLHRAYHEVQLMRRFHRVHHLDEQLDTTSAVRFHPGEVALSALLRMAPVTLAAIPFSHVVIFETVLLGASFFHHSNLRLPRATERVISWIFVTPSIHWVHHHAVPQDTNSNYAAVFSLWDRLFGSKSPSKRMPEMKIGLADVADKSVIGLLLAPFQSAEKQ
jgi:sterol desaturase/sphingolipid hydroxylase (fatty acid hydroxylase superfamily)